MEELIQFTNSGEFFTGWAFYMTGFNLMPMTDKLIVSLEAVNDSLECIEEKKSWNITCDGFVAQRLTAGYLVPFYEVRVLPEHPLLWNYGSETVLTIYGGSLKNIVILMGELFLVHNDTCGNWVQFHRIFGFLPALLKTNTKFQLLVPTSMAEHYMPVMQRHEIECTAQLLEKNNKDLSVLFFGSKHYPDSFDYGQPYIIANSFKILDSHS